MVNFRGIRQDALDLEKKRCFRDAKKGFVLLFESSKSVKTLFRMLRIVASVTN